MKPIIYIRTSTEDQNPENQLKDIYSIIPESISKEQIEVFKDKQSAFKDNIERDDFNKIKSLIKKNEVSDLYVWDWDRIYRNRIKLKEFFALCKMYKVKIHSFRQSWYEDLNKIPMPFNEIMIDLMLNLMGWLAEDESKKKSERIKASIRQKKGKTISHRGKKWGRKGLPKQTKEKIKELHKQGFSIRSIASQVKTTDKNHNMKPISKSVVHKVLKDV